MAELCMSRSAQRCFPTLPFCNAQVPLQLLSECLDLVISVTEIHISGAHVFSPPWENTPPEAFPDLTFRPGTSQGSGRSSRWQRGCRFPRADRAWTRRDCPPAHSAHQKTARGRCRCNLERVREHHTGTVSSWKNETEHGGAVPGADSTQEGSIWPP